MTDLADRQQEAQDIGRSIRTPQELWEAYEALADLERALVEAARRMHREGHSWAALAAPFGISRQGARKRWADDRPAGWVDEATGLTSGGLVAACSLCGSLDHEKHPS